MATPHRPAGPTLLASFAALGWAPAGVEAWQGDELPDGVPVSSACVFLITRSDHLLLVEVLRRGWDLPGGHVEDGENPVQALGRELKEEVGVRPELYGAPRLLGWFHILPGEPTGKGALMLVYVATLTEGVDPHTEVPREIGEVRAFPLSDLPVATHDLIWAPYVPLAARVTRSAGSAATGSTGADGATGGRA